MTPKITENCSLPSYRNASEPFASSRPPTLTGLVDTLLTALPSQATGFSLPCHNLACLCLSHPHDSQGAAG